MDPSGDMRSESCGSSDALDTGGRQRPGKDHDPEADSAAPAGASGRGEGKVSGSSKARGSDISDAFRGL